MKDAKPRKLPDWIVILVVAVVIIMVMALGIYRAVSLRKERFVQRNKVFLSQAEKLKVGMKRTEVEYTLGVGSGIPSGKEMQKFLPPRHTSAQYESRDAEVSVVYNENDEVVNININDS